MSKREWRLFIEDILESIEKIETYIRDMDFENFKKDDRTIDAVVRNLGVIGEAARNVEIEIKNKYSNVPWQDITDFRNRITHAYFTLSLPIVWHILKQELPSLKKRMKQILEEERK